MAGDWIRMRVGLTTNPHVLRIAEHLLGSRDFLDWAGLSWGIAGYPPPSKEDDAQDRYVALRVTRYVTVTALLRFWGYANEHAKGDFIDGVRPQDVLEISGVPGFATALEAVGWVEFDHQKGGVRMPNFAEHNTGARERSTTGAERQKRYRERQKTTPESDVTRDVTSQEREEKRREEKRDTPKAPKGAPVDVPDWVPAEPWREFVAMRKAKGSRTPFTIGAAKGVIAKLSAFREAGHDLAVVLEQSTISGWADVYEPKAKPAGAAQKDAFV
jgi:hypothetical protein